MQRTFKPKLFDSAVSKGHVHTLRLTDFDPLCSCGQLVVVVTMTDSSKTFKSSVRFWSSEFACYLKVQSNFTKPYWFVFGPLLLASSVRFYRERTNDALAGARTYKPWKRLTHYQFYFFARSSLLSKTVHFRLACNVKNTECLASTFDMKFERSSKQLEFKAQLSTVLPR